MATGEIIALGVAASWTMTAMFGEVATKRSGSLPVNVIRMTLSLMFLMVTLWLTLGSPYPVYSDAKTWFWLSLSGVVGYVFGDYCLFQSYVLMNSRFGQLFMTLASPAAAIAAYILLGERMSALSIIGMVVTIAGISISVLNKKDKSDRESGHLSLKLPLKGILFGIGAGVGQGFGLVLSKIGIVHYQDCIMACGISDMSTFIPVDAIIPVPLVFVMPFAATMIRAVTGLIGFSAAQYISYRRGGKRFVDAVNDRTTMLCALGGSMFGPFVGVALSLLATMYTNAGVAQCIMSLTPILIILPSVLVFHQKVTFLEVLGAIISVSGVTLFFI